jgi:hypothetical protein
MRVTREKAAENRARIVATASRLFREKGFDGVGLDAIMKEAGLTHGGFYGISHVRKISRPRRWRMPWSTAPSCRADIRTSLISFPVICPKAISRTALMAVRWPHWAETWRAEAKEFAQAPRPTCALSWSGSRASSGAPPPPGVGGPSPPLPELSAL